MEISVFCLIKSVWGGDIVGMLSAADNSLGTEKFSVLCQI